MSYTTRLVLLPDQDDRKTVDILQLLDRLTFPLDDPMVIVGKWWWLIRDPEENACGFAGLEKIDENAAFLCRVGIRIAHRGHGLHIKCIRLRETLARKEGFKHLVTYTSPENFSSANNLIKCGFTLYKPASTLKWLHFYKCLDETLTRKEIRDWQQNAEIEL